ncbi:MAG: putative quinol monooxygenase [Pseudomonadota bacterium]
MSGVIVGGFVSFAPGEVEKLRPHLDTLITATRQEPGCLVYSHATREEEPDTVVVFELWESDAALRRHLTTAHVAAWYLQIQTATVLDSMVKAYPFEEARRLRDYRD